MKANLPGEEDDPAKLVLVQSINNYVSKLRQGQGVEGAVTGSSGRCGVGS